MLKTLMEKVDNMQEQMGNKSRENGTSNKRLKGNTRNEKPYNRHEDCL